MKQALRAGKNLREASNDMERYLAFLDKLSETAPNLLKARKTEELYSIEDYEKYIKSNFEEYMKSIAGVKAKIGML